MSRADGSLPSETARMKPGGEISCKSVESATYSKMVSVEPTGVPPNCAPSWLTSPR